MDGDVTEALDAYAQACLVLESCTVLRRSKSRSRSTSTSTSTIYHLLVEDITGIGAVVLTLFC